MEKLKKELGGLDLFSIASGAMISSGLFVLPAVIYGKLGPSIILAYLFAAILVIPALVSKIELATAMPKTGGDYFFIQRSLGPLFGTFAGFSAWFSLTLKTAFALVGIGIFLQPLLPYFPGYTVKLIAVGFTLIFTALNILSVKESGKFQTILVMGLFAILVTYSVIGLTKFQGDYYSPFMGGTWKDIMAATGMVFVSFGGLTKIASIAEEIKNPTKQLPKGMVASFILVSALYFLVITITLGIIPGVELSETLTPISLGGMKILGNTGLWILSIAAMLAFVTTGNAGLMASSRNPLAMAKDNLLPPFLSRVNPKLKTPVISILFTSGFMICAILFLDLESLVKVASTMMLLLYSFANISVVLMRESKIVSYKPTFKSPFYPGIQIVGTILYIVLIIQMGTLPLALTGIFFLISLLWYFLYSRSRARRESALLHIVERLTADALKTRNLSTELKDILLERDEIVEDRFDEIIKNALFIDQEEETDMDGLFGILAKSFSDRLETSEKEIRALLHEREKDSSTSIHPGLAIPHIVIEGEHQFDIVVVRSVKGIKFHEDIPLVNIVFALAGSRDERSFHLQALMAIAQIVQNKDFEHRWMKTRNVDDLKNLILLTQRVRKGTV